jgi:hypothetical protein
VGELLLHVTVRDDRPLSAPFTLTVSVICPLLPTLGFKEDASHNGDNDSSPSVTTKSSLQLSYVSPTSTTS